MGYSERLCQLCGISFNVGRVRSADEPIEAGWNGCGLGNSPIQAFSGLCDSKDCKNEWRTLVEYTYHDGSVEGPKDVEEHLAGPSCNSCKGYTRMSAEEMMDCVKVQCIGYKGEDWSPEPGDEDFVIHSRDCFLTGISKGPPHEFEVYDLEPHRHGIKDTWISNDNEVDNSWATPVHPYCFDIFKRLSLEMLDKVDIDGLRELWRQRGMYAIPSSADRYLVNQQFYTYYPGTDYLVANPLQIPGIEDLIKRCEVAGNEHHDVVFEASNVDPASHDPFVALSAELKQILILQLPYRAVANLRLASHSFRQLPQAYFRHLIKTEMPWFWEIESLQPKQVNWHKLWCELSAADGGSLVDEQQRKWIYDAKNPGSGAWDRLIGEMSEDERMRYDIQPRSCAGEAYPDSKDMARRLAPLRKERSLAGRWWPKSTELKGLRNRRRIYGDVRYVLHEINRLEVEAA